MDSYMNSSFHSPRTILQKFISFTPKSSIEREGTAVSTNFDQLNASTKSELSPSSQYEESTISRLHSSYKQHDYWIEEQKFRKYLSEKLAMQQKPNINKNSKTLYASKLKPIYQRINDVIKQREVMLNKMQEESENKKKEQEDKECTFRPNSRNNTPKRNENRINESFNSPGKLVNRKVEPKLTENNINKSNIVQKQPDKLKQDNRSETPKIIRKTHENISIVTTKTAKKLPKTINRSKTPQTFRTSPEKKMQTHRLKAQAGYSPHPTTLSFSEEFQFYSPSKSQSPSPIKSRPKSPSPTPPENIFYSLPKYLSNSPLHSHAYKIEISSLSALKSPK
ncbi:unnamed protein product [Blepharisma stoltei]|uniref:Uncharacterized protein n=1 Tax=Blepharisma stoltei TaxID=1481888 RepID=A0AAU9IZ94_9CILI|nr:unnamed protein product [Blepharisma stoltei]